MNVPNVRVVAGKKFYWDGREYPASDAAATAQAGYERDGFETCLADGEGTFLVYTRRVVRQVGDAQVN
jgi:hypothetical protein